MNSIMTDSRRTTVLGFRRPVLIGLLGLLLVVESGCSVFMAARAPQKRDLSVLTPGISRSRVISELGKPVESRQTAEGTTDVYAFQQGYETPTRVSRVLFHGVADVVTGGLWELAGTPIELALDGEEVRAEIRYTPADTISRIEYFSGAHLAHGGPTLAGWMRPGDQKETAIVEAAPAPTLATPEIMQASGTVEAADSDTPGSPRPAAN